MGQRVMGVQHEHLGRTVIVGTEELQYLLRKLRSALRISGPFATLFFVHGQPSSTRCVHACQQFMGFGSQVIRRPDRGRV